MSLTPDWAPNIHPIIVHFPIALLAAGLVVDLVSLFMRQRAGVRDAATWLYCAGAATAILAYFTGRSGADAMLLPAQVAPLVSEHADWAFRTTWFFAFFASARLAVSYILPPKPIVLVSTFVVALAGIGMLFETAEHGALLVYQHGLGVATITADESVDDVIAEATADQPVDPGILDLQDGSWVWRPVAGAETVLADQFTWLRNDASHLAPEMVDDTAKGAVLALRPRQAEGVWSAGDAIDAAQADLYVNVDSFEGELQLLLHVQDAQTFDFLSIEKMGQTGKTAVKLGRMAGGEVTVWEEKPREDSGWLFLRVFGGDGHFRGYVNEELVTHGHADDLDAGPVGLRVNGTGTILIEQIHVQAVTD